MGMPSRYQSMHGKYSCLDVANRFLKQQNNAYLVLDWNSKVPSPTRTITMRAARRGDSVYGLGGRHGCHDVSLTVGIKCRSKKQTRYNNDEEFVSDLKLG